METVEDRLKCTKPNYFLVPLVEDNGSEKDARPALSCDSHSFPMPYERAPVEDTANRF